MSALYIFIKSNMLCDVLPSFSSLFMTVKHIPQRNTQPKLAATRPNVVSSIKRSVCLPVMELVVDVQTELVLVGRPEGEVDVHGEGVVAAVRVSAAGAALDAELA